MAAPWAGVINKVDDYRWEIPVSYKKGMRVPGLIYASETMLEMPHNKFMGVEKLLEQQAGGVLSLVDIKESVVKRLSEFFSGSVERNRSMNLSFPAFGKKMIGNGSNQNSQKNIRTFFDETGDLHLTLDPFLWIGFLLVILYWVAYVIFSLIGIFIRNTFNYICDRLYEYYYGQR